MSDASTQGNQAKYQSYRLAHERMSAAIEARFPLEAVAIAESLLSDRLLSFANGHGAGFEADKITLRQVTPKVAKICRETKDAEGQALAHAADQWAVERNKVLHQIAKSGQGDGPPIAADSFLESAMEVAVRGVELVKGVKAWHQKQLRAAAQNG